MFSVLKQKLVKKKKKDKGSAKDGTTGKNADLNGVSKKNCHF